MLERVLPIDTKIAQSDFDQIYGDSIRRLLESNCQSI
jgi:hypothetical protein